MQSPVASPLGMSFAMLERCLVSFVPLSNATFNRFSLGTGLASKFFLDVGLMKLGERSPNPVRTLEMDE